MRMSVFAITFLLPGLLCAQNSVLDAYAKGKQLRLQERLVEAEEQRLKAETELLQEQSRQLRERHPAWVDLASPGPNTQPLIRQAWDKTIVNHPDLLQYEKTMLEIAKLWDEEHAKETLVYYELHLQSLYLLARYLKESSKTAGDSVQTLPEGLLNGKAQ